MKTPITSSHLPANSKLRPRHRKTAANVNEGLRSRESLIIFLVSFVFYMILSIIFNKILILGNGDALSRTANAYYVFYSRDPHLAAIGFFWPPLPSILQLPLLPFLRQSGQVLLAGLLVSAVFGAGSLVLLNKILAKLRLAETLRWIIVFLTFIHPNFAYLSSIGMAEPILTFFILLSIWGYLQMPYGTSSWVICGTGLAMAFFVRYEALAVMAGVMLAVITLLWMSSEDWQSKLEGQLLAVLVPPAYAVGIWMFLNWIVMDSPLYFAFSEYSLSTAVDTAKIAGVAHHLYLAWGNIFYTLSYTFERVTQQNLAFIASTFTAVLAIIIKRNKRMAGLLIILMVIPAFSSLLVFMGSLPTWFRYWVYVAPFGAILIGMNYYLIKGNLQKIITGMLVVLYALSIPYSIYVMDTETINEGDLQRLGAYILEPEKEPSLRQYDGYYTFVTDAQTIAAKVDEFSEDGLVMVDASKSHFVIMAVKHPERLMITNDTDFHDALLHPRGKVKYILVPEIGNIFELNYAGIYNGIYDWAKVVYEFPDTMNHYRILEVVP